MNLYSKQKPDFLPASVQRPGLLPISFPPPGKTGALTSFPGAVAGAGLCPWERHRRI